MNANDEWVRMLEEVTVVCLYFDGSMMEAARASETSAISTRLRHYIPEDCHLHETPNTGH
jgi:hypothetical protein